MRNLKQPKSTENFPNQNFGRNIKPDDIDDIYDKYAAEGFPNQNFGRTVEPDDIDDLADKFAANGSVTDGWNASGKAEWSNQLSKGNQADGLSESDQWLNGSGKLKKFFSEITIKKIINKAESDMKDVYKISARYNPVVAIGRLAVRAAIQLNTAGSATKLYGAIVPLEAAIIGRIRPDYIATAKLRYDKIKQWYVNDLGGQEAHLKSSIMTGEKNLPISLNRILHGKKEELARYYVANQPSSKTTSGSFDWIGKGDYDGKANYWAAIHSLDFAKNDIKVGDSVLISETTWDMNGKFVKVLKLNSAAGTIIVNTPAPTTANVLKGKWQKITTAGSFDWIGKGDYEGKTNYYAALHILEFMQAPFKAGNTILITGTGTALDGKTAKVLKINYSAATIVLNIPAPTTTAVVKGKWENVPDYGMFDWVGSTVIGGKKYAAPHILDFLKVPFAIGETIRISGSNWKEMEGKTTKVLKLNNAAATIVLDVLAPTNTEAVFGKWEKMNTATATEGFTIKTPTGSTPNGSLALGGSTTATIKLSASGSWNDNQNTWNNDTWKNADGYGIPHPAKNKGWLNAAIIDDISFIVIGIAEVIELLNMCGLKIGETDPKVSSDATLDEKVTKAAADSDVNDPIIQQNTKDIKTMMQENGELQNMPTKITDAPAVDLLTTNFTKLKKAVANDTTQTDQQRQSTLAQLDSIQKKKIAVVGIGSAIALALVGTLYFIFKPKTS